MSARGYRLHPAATEELDAAGEWYDAQLPGLSLELFDAVEEAIALILERPLAWQRDSTVCGREIGDSCCGGFHSRSCTTWSMTSSGS